MLKSFLKLGAIYIIKGFMWFLHIFPIKKNRIIFNAYSGKQYACNPKYISEYLGKHYPNKYELIWAIRNAKSHVEIRDQGMETVEYFSLKRLYYEATAKVSINNIGSFSWMPNTQRQLRINTWHGGGCYKKVGLSEKHNDCIMKKTMQLTTENTSYMIASSQYIADVVFPQDFGYHGKMLRIGMPRNDIFFECNRKLIKKKVCETLEISEHQHILLYAPTWRYNSETNFLMDFQRIKDACTLRFGGEWTIFTRMHLLMKNFSSTEVTVCVDNYPDMQELLVAADILISDYSSCIWDFSLQIEKPCFLYVPDLDNYEKKRGFDMEIEQWGFPVCRTESELENQIEIWNMENAEMAMRQHHDQLNSYECGTACENVAQLIEAFCFGEVKDGK